MLRVRGGIARYHHDEIEPDGAIATSFFTRGGELRAELEQADRGGWGGTSGRPVPQEIGARSTARKNTSPTRASASSACSRCKATRPATGASKAARGSKPRASPPTPTSSSARPPGERRFTTLSGSLGALYELSPGWKAGLNLSRSSRAPAIDELFANGPHAGTQAFEIGDPDLDAERSLGIEASLRRTAGPVRAHAHRLRHALRQLHLPVPDRRDRGRPARPRLSPGRGALPRVRGRGRRHARHLRRDRVGRRGAGRCGPRDDRRRRPRAVHPAAAPARRADRRARRIRRPDRGRARPARRPHRRPRDRNPGLHNGQCRARMAPARCSAPASRWRWPRTTSSTSRRGAIRACSRIMRRWRGATCA